MNRRPYNNKNNNREKEKEDDEEGNKEKENIYAGLDRAENNQLIDDFFNFKIQPRKKEKKLVNFAIVPKPLTVEKEPLKRVFSGTSYAEKYHREFNLASAKSSEACSSIGFSHLSGPSASVTNSFFEDDDVEISHDSTFRYHRMSLPIFSFRQNIIADIRNHSITIISGPTGCGKSTQVPQYIYEDCMKRGESCNILVSQPRKIAAITIAQRVALERGVRVGEEVGYQVALNRHIDESDEVATSINYCTTGVILAKLIQRRSMAAFTHIIMDEIHERNVDTDLLIAVIRQLLLYNSPNTKIILMSATLHTDQFVDFFTVTTGDNEKILPPIITMDEGCFELEFNYLEDVQKLVKTRSEKLINYNEPGISEDMYKLAAQLLLLTIQPMLLKDPSYSTTFLVFLPGIHEIETFQRKLMDEKKSYTCAVDIYILHSMLSTEDQAKVFASNFGVKIILSTNISESSVTIPNVTHVVDFCLTKYQGSVIGSRMSTLITDWASQNNCKQRAGRAGRVSRGIIYRLVARSFFNNKLKVHQKPEITCIPLETVVLKIKQLEMGSPCELLAVTMDPPDMGQIVDAILSLKELGGINILDYDGKFNFEDGEITFLGNVMASLPCDVRISKLIIMGYLFSVLNEAIIIGAGLSVQGVFLWSAENKMRNYDSKLKWSDGSESDLIAVLNAYSKWVDLHDTNFFPSEIDERLWCRNNSLDYKNLQEMRLLIADLKKRLQNLNIKNLPQGKQPTWALREKQFILKTVFAGAFGIANYFQPVNSYKIDRDTASTLNNLNPNKTVYFKKMRRNLFGCVYENQVIEELIAEGVCTPDSKVTVTFDNDRSERVYVQFHGEFKDSYDHIPPEMYRAVKLRRLKNGIGLRVMDELSTLNYAESKNLLDFEQGVYVEKKIYIKNPEWCPLPTCFVTEMHGIVTHVFSIQKFFFRPYIAKGKKLVPDDEHYKEIVFEIRRILNHSDIVTLNESNRKLTVDELVVVNRLEVGYLERATFIKLLNESVALVHLIDSGNNAEIDTVNLFAFKNVNDKNKLRLMEIPSRCFECRLQEIQPSFIKSFTDAWSVEGVNLYRAALTGKRVRIEIFCVFDDIVSVKLYQKDENGNEFCWNDKLIAEGYGVECDESYQNIMAHEQRIRRESAFPVAHGPEIEFAQKIDMKAEKKFQPPSRYGCDINFRLEGPFTPLEVQIRGNAFHQKSNVFIDGSSVNQVMLNNTLNQIEGKFCVASEIFFTNINEQMKLRETTILPNIPGLPVLLALIFCPTVQLRRNKDKTRYDSIIVGLGADEQGNSYYLDRDCVLDVDFDLAENDIQVINNLRLAMSHLIYSDPKSEKLVNLYDGQRETALLKIKKHFTDLINTPRFTCGAANMSGKNYKWNDDQMDIVTPSNVQGYRAVYSLISFPKLEKMTADMKSNLLKYVQEMDYCLLCLKHPDQRMCKLCNEFLDNFQDFKMHMASKKHIKNKAQVLKMTVL